MTLKSPAINVLRRGTPLVWLVFLLALPAAANHVTPIFIAGNPSCADLGFDFGFKPQPEPPPSGTYTFPAPDGVNTVTISSDGTFFDFSSTLSLDVAIVKGGPNANVYVYDPEASSDSGLSSPINPNNDQPFAISHIEFCYDYEVDVSKSARTSFTRTWEWRIDKSVAPESWSLFDGDRGTSRYTVALVRTGFTDSDWAVAGDITIDNNTPFDAVIESVNDVLSPGIALAVDCGVSFPYLLAAGDSLVCSYASALPDGSSRVNTATVHTSGLVGGGEAEASVVFGAPTTEVNAAVHVSDTNGDSWLFSGNGSVSYERTFACGSDEGSHPNVATIVETGQSDSANVRVDCYRPTVTKTAGTSFSRTFDWSLVKSADQTNLTLSEGQQFQVNYLVEIGADPVDSDWAAHGEIRVSNPNPSRAAQLVAVSDVMSPNLGASVSCPALIVPAGGSLVCTYNGSLPDASPRTNTATATLQNFAFAADGSPFPLGTSDYSGTAPVTFGNPTVVIDDCIELSDTNLDPPLIGTVCVDALPLQLDYGLFVGPYDVCGQHEVTNTASFETDDTGTTGSDTWTVTVDVPCDTGCTLTPGYWKTHSLRGPAPYDDTWALLDPREESTPFFLSGQSYYEVLWTPPRGNAYYILARAYIAAELNLLNGASMPADVNEAFASAADLFSQATPDEVGAYKGKKRALVLGWAYILDEYNNGISGPGHCSEE